jgi:hypothetical protein
MVSTGTIRFFLGRFQESFLRRAGSEIAAGEMQLVNQTSRVDCDDDLHLRNHRESRLETIFAPKKTVVMSIDLLTLKWITARASSGGFHLRVAQIVVNAEQPKA